MMRSGFPIELPQLGICSTAVLNSLAPNILGGAARWGEATSFAHMDPPPTPWIFQHLGRATQRGFGIHHPVMFVEPALSITPSISVTLRVVRDVALVVGACQCRQKLAPKHLGQGLHRKQEDDRLSDTRPKLLIFMTLKFSWI
jgi:hypothetical protein